MYQRLPAVALGMVAAAGLAAGATLAPQPASAQQISISADGRNTSIALSPASPALAAQALAANKPIPMPQADFSKMLGGGGKSSSSFGSFRIPYTTMGAYADFNGGTPVQFYPWRAAGKLFMYDGTNFLGTCSASVIAKGLVVTAAHCIASFGSGFSITTALFVPAWHNGSAPYGVWQITNAVAPTRYLNGTDFCPQAGVVCENDLAILIMGTGPAPFAGKHIAQVVGRFRYYVRNQGYTPFILDPRFRTTHVTLLGYPGSLDNGQKMIRTDSIGIQDANNQLLIGSDQSQGSSGGPWVVNFGRRVKITPTSQDPKPFGKFRHQNRLVGVTSYGNASAKRQGASRFNNNRAYPAPGLTNIDSLINTACGVSPGNC